MIFETQLKLDRLAKIGHPETIVAATNPAMIALVVRQPAGADPISPVGSWTGVAHCDRGWCAGKDFPGTTVIDSWDPATGTIAGHDGGSGVMTGTFDGSVMNTTTTSPGYTSHGTATMSADGNSWSGTWADSNNVGGTDKSTRVAVAPTSAPSPSPTPTPTPTPTPPPATSCTFGGFGGGSALVATTTDPAIVDRIGGTADTMPSPGGIVVDSTDPRGRVFVANSTAGTLSVIYGRTLDASAIHVETRVAVGQSPDALALDPGTGHIFVSLAADCAIAEVDGRAGTPALMRTVVVPGSPAQRCGFYE